MLDWPGRRRSAVAAHRRNQEAGAAAAGFGWPGALGLLLAALGAWFLAQGSRSKEDGAGEGGGGAGPSRLDATGGGSGGGRRHRCLLVSTLGTLFEAGSPEDLARAGRAPAVRVGEVETLKVLARGGARLFLLTHCLDSGSESGALLALEGCGLVGDGGGREGGQAGAGAGVDSTSAADGRGGAGAGVVPRHRVLFCSTLPGKVAVARQLEPDLYVDCETATLEELRRFNLKVLRIQRQELGGGAGGRGGEGGGPSMGKAPAGSLVAQTMGDFFLPNRQE